MKNHGAFLTKLIKQTRDAVPHATSPIITMRCGNVYKKCMRGSRAHLLLIDKGYHEARPR